MKRELKVGDIVGYKVVEDVYVPLWRVPLESEIEVWRHGIILQLDTGTAVVRCMDGVNRTFPIWELA